MTSTGEVYAQVRTAGNVFVVLHPGGPMPLLFSAGDTVAVEANFFIQPYNFLVRGTGSGSARVLLGMPGSLFELGPGGPHPLLVLGDRLSSGEAFQGVWTYPPGVENSLGDVYLVSNNSVLLRPTAGRVETIVPAHSLLSDGASLNLRGGLGVNDGGVVAFSADTDQGQSRLYLWEDGRLELLACTGDSSECPALNPTGGTVEYWQEEEYAVDEQNRVMAFFQMAGGPSGYYLFSNGHWEATALLGESQIEGKTVTSVASVQAVDNRFYAVFSRNTNQSMDTIAVLEGQTWRSLLTVKQAFLNQELGQTYFDTLLDVNRRGELAFSVNGNTVAFHSSESTKIVHTGNKETADGDFLLQTHQLDLRDDGRLYFTARNQRDEEVIYLAQPVTPPRQTPSRFPVPFRSRQHPR